MLEREAREITLTITPGGEQLTGVVRDGAHERPFIGLLGLAGALQGLMHDDLPDKPDGEDA